MKSDTCRKLALPFDGALGSRIRIQRQRTAVGVRLPNLALHVCVGDFIEGRPLTSVKRTRILCNAVIIVTPGGSWEVCPVNPEVTSRPSPPTMLDYMSWTAIGSRSL